MFRNQKKEDLCAPALFPASQEPLLCPLDLRRRHPVWRPTALWLLPSFPGTLPSGRLSLYKNFAG